MGREGGRPLRPRANSRTVGGERKKMQVMEKSARRKTRRGKGEHRKRWGHGVMPSQSGHLPGNKKGNRAREERLHTTKKGMDRKKGRSSIPSL